MAFNPELGNWFPVTKFRFWCQKVLPLVYDDSLSYYELLCKVVDYLNKYGEDLGLLADEYKALVEWVNHYFEQNLEPIIQQYVDEWLDDHPEATTTVQDGSITVEKFHNTVVDETLTESGHPADAKVVGDMLIPTSAEMDKQLDDPTFVFGQGSNAIFACAATWLKNNDKLYYGNADLCNSFYVDADGNVIPAYEPKPGIEIEGRFPLDCMAFVDMCLRGIGFEDSMYGNQSNQSRYPCTSLKWSSKQFNMYAKVWDNTLEIAPVIKDNDSYWTPTNDYHRVLTWQYARFLRDHDLYVPLRGVTNLKMKQCLRVGDILWFGNPENSEYAGHFDGIYHCAIFMGWNKDQCMILDCNGIDANATVSIRHATGAHSSAYLMGYSRIPLGTTGTTGMESGIDLRISNGAFSGYASTQEKVYLKTKTRKFNTYKFTVSYMYFSAVDATRAFPSILWGASYLNVNRLTANSVKHVESYKFYTDDIIVTINNTDANFDASQVTDVNDYFMAQFYPAPSSTAYIHIDKVEPILLIDGIDSGDYLRLNRQTYSFTDYHDACNYMATNFLANVNSDSIMRFKFWTNTVGGSGQNLSAAIVKYRTDTYKVAVWNNTGYGCIMTKKFGVTDPVYTDYTSSNPFPLEDWVG